MALGMLNLIQHLYVLSIKGPDPDGKSESDVESSLFFRASTFPWQKGNLRLFHNHQFRKLKQ